MATAPMGRFTKKIHRQPSPPTSRPPIVGPAIVASPATPPQIPIAVPLRPAGKVAMMIAIVCGTNKAAPSPWTALAAMTSAAVCEMPQAAEARVNTAMPAMNSARFPRRSPSRPAVIMSTARTIT
jgi:hypothetical protein